MAKPRRQQICLEATPYYHITSRCVRRAFLCGLDSLSGQSYEHRRDWIANRLAELAEIFCIDIAAYAIMSNHYHLVLHINQQAALILDKDEVIDRWKRLAKLPLTVERYTQGELLSKAEHLLIETLVRRWRNRLYDISWFMRYLNESVARMANEEDQCTGRFWEGRYKSQALLDEAALLTCMTYVDLNPIRAKMAETPEGSDYTSIQSRIKANEKQSTKCYPIKLQHFLGNERSNQEQQGISFSLSDYLQLIDTTGRAIVENKRGYIPAHMAPILDRLGISPENWLENVTEFEKRFNLAIGTIEKLKDVAAKLKQQWLKGTSASRRLYKLQPS